VVGLARRTPVVWVDCVSSTPRSMWLFSTRDSSHPNRPQVCNANACQVISSARPTRLIRLARSRGSFEFVLATRPCLSEPWARLAQRQPLLKTISGYAIDVLSRHEFADCRSEKITERPLHPAHGREKGESRPGRNAEAPLSDSMQINLLSLTKPC